MRGGAGTVDGAVRDLLGRAMVWAEGDERWFGTVLMEQRGEGWARSVDGAVVDLEGQCELDRGGMDLQAWDLANGRWDQRGDGEGSGMS